MAPHAEPRYLTLTDREAQSSSVMALFKHPAPNMKCPDDYLQHCRRCGLTLPSLLPHLDPQGQGCAALATEADPTSAQPLLTASSIYRAYVEG